MAPERRRLDYRVIIGVVVALVIVVVLGVGWASSLLPASYSVMGMGYADFGGGRPDPGHAGHAAGVGWEGLPRRPGDVSVPDLTGPRGDEADVAMELVARRERVTLGGRMAVDGYTLNGTSPGPEIRVQQGDLVQVRLVNESVPDGATLHWHGVDLPNAEDGVAGVTQDAVPVGGSHTYRFVAEDAGTYWYHSHQVSHVQVRGGLFGTLVVEPATGSPADHDLVAVTHTYGSVATVNGVAGDVRHPTKPGESVRVRVVNTDDGLRRVWSSGVPFHVVAVDGRDVNQPEPVEDQAVLIAAGGRVDLEFVTPDDGSAVRIGLGARSLVVGPAGTRAPKSAQPQAVLDLLDYGTPAPLPFDVDEVDRTFVYHINKRPGFLDGRPGIFWTINGRMYPDVPMYMVAEGDVVRMRIANSKTDNHPMHLHGHHAVVLARNGVAATGSPWWFDSLDVGRGETYDIAFVADNPGIWMDHCHDLPHAVDGLVAHLAYSGVHTPFRIGGDAANEPE